MNPSGIPSRMALAFALWRTRWKLASRAGLALQTTSARGAGACSTAQARELALAIEQAAIFVPGSRCLDRSLLLQRLLGEGAVLRIGVRRAAGKVSAHAWVEVNGTVVNDDPETIATFVPLEGVAAAANMLPYD